ncbi:hypothetical protein AMTRI_Chr11g94840 [Amborella trichopoda]|uniref:S-locus glycoprotein domain-containing protein n=1 Tax=Amborella trichopoda TaxID=13333 RepID=U5CS61_AMBTC|nr:G-type lectin S-receptor-like serine/threonine-protein kinase LECRK2 [Amborella trichopoda]ERN16046.1 hypothetical protein AMTR_s00030p00114790 [Amborella trichopoda]|eukprot:XP_006854579.1 G-type lectin S-receptor-like serine/threonine-protein kinase LECRK2 [Amborella trichopoda]
MLASSSSKTNHSVGKFRLGLSKSGLLVLYAMENPNSIATTEDIYWKLLTFPIPLRRLSLELISNAPGIKFSDSHDFMLRATLDIDGNLRIYQHNFAKEGKNSVTIIWSALKNQCKIKGVCGVNRYCTLGDSDEPKCLCIPGFDYTHPGNPTEGCKMLDSVGKSSDLGESMTELKNTVWASRGCEILNVNKTECTKSCSEDCVCRAVVYVKGECTKMSEPLKYGLTDMEGWRSTFVRGGGGVARSEKVGVEGREIGNKLVVIGFVLVCAAVLMVGTRLLVCFLERKWWRINRNEFSSG